MTIEDAIKFFEKQGFRFQKQDTAIEALKQPEIVRCKDCRFRVLHQCNCEKKENVTYGMFTEDDFFCANGERKE